MAEYAERNRWDHTSAVLAMIANVNRAPGRAPVSPDQFNPYRQTKPVAKLTPEETASYLVSVFVPGKNNG